MSKYKINREFGIYRYMKTPVMPLKMAGFIGSLMRPPKWIRHDKEVSVRSHQIPGCYGTLSRFWYSRLPAYAENHRVLFTIMAVVSFSVRPAITTAWQSNMRSVPAVR